MKKKIAKILIYAGVILIVAATILLVYNIWDAKRAAEASREVVEKLKEEIEEPEDDLANEYLHFSQMEMPVAEVDGYRYVGIIRIPEMEIELPVMEECDLSRLKISPCRYAGSVYARDIVIAGHNYSKHFSPIKQLVTGDKVEFEDVLGNCFHYEVIDAQVIQPTDIEGMLKGEDDTWDLSLFTCTTGGSARCAVRCQLTDNYAE